MPLASAQPHELGAFVALHDRCLHDAGKEANDEALRGQLARTMHATCAAAKMQFRSLIQRARRQTDLPAWLQRYGRDVGSLPEG
jgi:hypothetical protein